MKKFLLGLAICVMCSLSASAYTYVKPSQSVYFNPQTSTWSEVKQSNDDVQLTNKSFIGSGGYEEYYYNDGKLAIRPIANLGFINNGQYIAINSQDLKFYKYTFKNGEFSYSELTPSYVQKLYPDYKIIKISEFKNNSITINKKFMKKQKVLLLNDTANSFYKYNYEPSSVNPSYIKQFVEISHKGKIIFSHYGDDTVESPALKIYVKNKF